MPRMTQHNKWKFVDHPIWGWRDLIVLNVNLAQHPDWPLQKGSVALGLDFILPPDIDRRRIGDLGNYVKGAEDCLQGVVFRNDKQVAEYLSPTRRRFGDLSGDSGLLLQIRWD